MESKGDCKVCVTGGAGYIGSALVRLLLQYGYTVHATLRNLGDESKVGLLKSFPYAKERLHLFEADIYNAQQFEKPIQGCVYVFHVAHPISKINGIVEATTHAVRMIADACIRSGTVKRLIYTGSVVTASPLKDDGNGYNMTIDESCWTPLNLNIPYTNDFLKDYTNSKTKAEQEILKIGEEETNDLEVVTLGCGFVGGAGYLPYPSDSVLVCISQVTNDAATNQLLRYLQQLLGKIPIVHVEDVCRAHIFCAETPFVKGRFLCASACVTTAEIAKYYQKTYPQLNQEHLEEHANEVQWGSKKLEDKGFVYKYSTDTILDECIEWGKGSGLI